jgi:tetratricopeptide (TPR) repeat protein
MSTAPAEGSLDFGSALRRAGRALADRGARIVRERATAPRLLSELEDSPPSRRRTLIETERRFRTYGLAERLLDECRRLWSDDPLRAEELGELAVAVTQSLRPLDYNPALIEDLAAEAWSVIANCRRIRADFQRVEEAFEIAEEHHRRGSGDPFEEAALLDLQASARFDQRRFEEAEALLHRAIELYRRTGDRHQEGRALMKLARLQRETRGVEEAISLVQMARKLVDPGREPRTRLALEQNLAAYLIEGGFLGEAQDVLELARRLATEIGSRADRLRVLWNEGSLLHRTGELARAQDTLRQVRDGFLQADLGYDAALVSLDLALVVLDTGDGARARALAADLVPLVSVRGIQREALAALGLVQGALQTESWRRT